jgi:methyl-accepting chemotaxis protein
MKRMGITAKIWLSIGVFVLGFVLSTILGQVQGISTEGNLRTTSEGLFPAAQRSQEAEFAFQRMGKGFSDAVMVQDASGLDRAAEEGRSVIAGLNAVADIKDLSAERSAGARKLASSVEQFVTDARGTYGAVLASPANMTPEMQERMRALASRTDVMKASLQSAKDQFTKDLHDQLSGVQARSVQQRWLALVVFGTTLIVAFVIVNLTIRRSIAGPILRVIHGVQEAADGAAHASNQMAESGQVVARDAQDQAASLEETSASLEEISATTRENANRANQADGLMRDAKQMIGRATQAMNDLTQSMDVISKSSKQVAAVLKSIDEIAFHTNILALNAAVEAARAGEAGAGFSVVADEVRSLAKRAAEAARHSAEIIEKTIGDVGNGVELVSLAHTAFNEVSATVSSGSQMVSQIASSSEEQARGVTHIGEAIHRIETVTQNNAANAQTTAEAASDMIAQVQTTRKHLDELVAVVGLRRP